MRGLVESLAPTLTGSITSLKRVNHDAPCHPNVNICDDDDEEEEEEEGEEDEKEEGELSHDSFLKALIVW